MFVAIVALVAIVFVLLTIPPTQRWLTGVVETELERILDTEVEIDHITIGFPNRLIIGGLSVEDLQGKRMLEVSRLATKFNWSPLLQDGRISLHTAQVFGLHAFLNRQHPDSIPNYQFLIDRLSSTDSTETSLPLDLRINSVLIRRARFCYDVYSEPYVAGLFDPDHVNVSDLNATIVLKAFNGDSINATIKRLEMEEQSGLALKSLQMSLLANNEKMVLKDFNLQLPSSQLMFDSIVAHYPLSEEKKLWDRLQVDGRLDNRSKIVLQDFAPLTPLFAQFVSPLWIAGNLQYRPGLARISHFKIHSSHNNVDMHMPEMELLMNDSLSPRLNSSLTLHADDSGLELLCRNLGILSPPELLRTGFLKFVGKVNGPFDNMHASGKLESAVGNIFTDLFLKLEADGALAYQGDVETEDVIDLMTLLGPEKKWGDTSFALHFKGSHLPGKLPAVYLQGVLPTLQYSGYEYQQIRMDGTLSTGCFDGLLSLDDPNLALGMNGRIDLNGRVPVFNLTAQVHHFYPHNLRLTEDRQGYEYGMTLKAEFSGNHLDNIDGEVCIDSLSVITPDDYYCLDNFSVRASKIEGRKKRLTIDGDFVDAVLEGEFVYGSLPASFQRILGKYFPSIIANAKGWPPTHNNFTFNLHLLNSSFYPLVLGVPLRLTPDFTCVGRVDDAQGIMEVKGYSPMLVYNGDRYESLLFRCENTEQTIQAEMRASKKMQGDEHMSMALAVNGVADNLNASLSWGNDGAVTYAGKIETDVTFSRQSKHSPYLQADVRLKPSEIILNDTVWQVQETSILVDSGYVNIRNLMVEHDDQYLKVNGRLTPHPADSLVVELSKINVKYILDIVRFRSVEFTGDATGYAYVSGALGDNRQADTRLEVKNFHFNGGLMGDMVVTGRWDDEQGVVLSADIHEEDLSHTTVDGFISPMAKGLDLQIGAGNTRLDFLNSFVGGIFENITGRVRGDIRLHGPFKALNLEGDAVADAVAKVKILNTPFTLLNDSVRLRKDYIEFPKVPVYDAEGHRGIVDGRLLHTHLGNMRYSFMIQTDNLLVYDTKDFGDMPFYGTIYGTGNARLWGGGNELHLNVNMRTGRNSQFVYNMSTPEAITDSRFITFVDKTPRPVAATPVHSLPLFSRREAAEEEDDDSPLEVFIDAAIDATPDATMKVLMDTRSGDHVAAKGNGTIHVNYTNEACNLRGTYVIESGNYKMSMQEVIRKDFLLQQGSEVKFSGNGGDADLNVKAVYTVNSASLSDLMPDASFNQNTVKVNCIINMTGKLANPQLNFDLELPTVNAEEQAMVRSAISTDEQRRMQFLYLLGIGKFYTYDYANTDGRSSSNTMSSLLSSTLSGQLNDILSNALNLNNWNFSSNLSTGQEGWSDLEVEGILSGSLLDNRMLINGNFGYRENSLSNSNFVGDFTLQYLLTPSGNIRLKAYNMTNDRYFAKQTFNTQGIGIIYKREFDNWRDFFKWRKKREASVKKQDIGQ